MKPLATTAPAPPTKARHVTIEFREDIPYSPELELKALLESSATETTTQPPPKPDSTTPATVRFNLD